MSRRAEAGFLRVPRGRRLPEIERAPGSVQRRLDHVGDVEEVFDVNGRAEAHLDGARQRADDEHRAALVRDELAAALDLEREAAGLRLDAREVVGALDELAV